MSGGKFEVYHPRLVNYDFKLNYDSLKGVNTEHNKYNNIEEITCVKLFRIDTLLQEVQSNIEQTESKKIVQNIYSLIHDINYSLSGDYRRNKYIDTYYDVKKDIEKVDNIKTNPDDFILNKQELSNLYTTKTIDIPVDKKNINIYELKNVNSIRCINDLISIEDIPKTEKTLLESAENILYNLIKNRPKQLNKEIKKFKTIKP